MKISPFISYAQSLAWISCFVALLVVIFMISSLLFFDLAHGNPYRPSRDLGTTVVIVPLLMALIAALGTLLVLTVPQFFQAFTIEALGRIFGDRARFAVLPVLPLTAILSWYCRDYLTPSYELGINAGPDWTPYQHGITLHRYFTTLMFQAAPTLFSLLHMDLGTRGKSRTRLLLVTAALVAIAGSIGGYTAAQQQIRLLETSTQPSR
ncbi:hypothetical protein IC762_32510 [Bradyrhizobium genosp. L]|uniref:hypothetical protein n=1 Tax=Bradyrhizobium genosp. L TaxID=83637 RepID=UPI0018A2783F|nr:hypothetical protein [Bradyrhizobium genosp. L]QPF84289.1 hypothetical protein IC762_32510 [Bradyrhizobium genosp. L]